MPDPCPHDLELAGDYELCRLCDYSRPSRALVQRARVADAQAASLPTFWSQVLEDEIVAAVFAGAFPRTAERARGVTLDMSRAWRANPRMLYGKRVEQAHQQALEGAEQKLYKEKLERWGEMARPDADEGAPGFAREQRVKVSGKVDHVHSAKPLEQLSDDELRAKLLELESADDVIEATVNEGEAP